MKYTEKLKENALTTDGLPARLRSFIDRVEAHKEKWDKFIAEFNENKSTLSGEQIIENQEKINEAKEILEDYDEQICVSIDEFLDAKAKEEADAKAKEEADAKAKEEADAKAKEGADAKAKEGADAKAKQEAGKTSVEENKKGVGLAEGFLGLLGLATLGFGAYKIFKK